MPDAGQPWNFCVPPNGRVRNAFSHRWSGVYGLAWKVGKQLCAADMFKKCPSGYSSRDLPMATTRAIDSGRSRRDYSGTNDAEAGKGWGAFASVQTLARTAGMLSWKTFLYDDADSFPYQTFPQPPPSLNTFIAISGSWLILLQSSRELRQTAKLLPFQQKQANQFLSLSTLI